MGRPSLPDGMFPILVKMVCKTVRTIDHSSRSGLPNFSFRNLPLAWRASASPLIVSALTRSRVLLSRSSYSTTTASGLLPSLTLAWARNSGGIFR